MQLIYGSIAQPDLALPEMAVQVERLKLAKRLWRGAADDGLEFGFELNAPIKDGDVVWQTSIARYVIRQLPEAVLEISLDVAPSAAAGIGWAIGNLHLELSAESKRLLTADEPAVRQLLKRLKVPFTPTLALFRPGRFARGDQSANEHGKSHKH